VNFAWVEERRTEYPVSVAVVPELGDVLTGG